MFMQNQNAVAWLTEVAPSGKVAPFPKDKESAGQFLDMLQSEPVDQFTDGRDVSQLALIPGISGAPKIPEGQQTLIPAKLGRQISGQVVAGAEKYGPTLPQSSKPVAQSLPADLKPDLVPAKRRSKSASVLDSFNALALPQTKTAPGPSHWVAQSSGSAKTSLGDAATPSKSADVARLSRTDSAPVAPLPTGEKRQPQVRQAPTGPVLDIKSSSMPPHGSKTLPQQSDGLPFRIPDQPELEAGPQVNPAESQSKLEPDGRNSLAGGAKVSETSPVVAKIPDQSPGDTEVLPQNALLETSSPRRDMTKKPEDGLPPTGVETAFARGTEGRRPALAQAVIAKPDAQPSSDPAALGGGPRGSFSKPELSLEHQGRKGASTAHLQEPAIQQRIVGSLGQTATTPETIQHFPVASRTEGGFSMIVDDGPGPVSQMTTPGPTAPSREAPVPTFQMQPAQSVPGAQISPVAQIAQAISTTNRSEIEVRLSPEELGSVRIVMSTRETGLHVTVFAEKTETLDLLRRDEAGFSADLESLGFSGNNLTFSQESADDPAPEHDLGLPGDDPGEQRRMVVLQQPSDRAGLDLRL